MGLVIPYSQKDSPFGKLFITFHEEPQVFMLPELFGEGAKKLRDVVESMYRKPWGNNTDYNRCMQMILAEMIRRRAEGEDLGSLQLMLMVFTDMQFDMSTDGNGYDTNMDVMEARFAAAGIPMPIIVFWNVRGCGCEAAVAAQPSRKNVVMLSGFSTNLMDDFFKMLESGEFADAHAPFASITSSTKKQQEDTEEKKPQEKRQLDTDNVIQLLLESEMYTSYKYVAAATTAT
jgi:hypothetical protein